MQELVGLVVNQRPRQYGASTLMGNTAIVAKIVKGAVSLVIMDLNEIAFKEVTLEELARGYMVDLTRQPWRTAQTFYAAIGPLQCRDESNQLLKRMLDKDFDPMQGVPAVLDWPKKDNEYLVCTDQLHRTCLVTYRDEACVQFIELTCDAFDVEEDTIREFDRRWKPLVGYPPERTAKLYASYAQYLGASQEVMEILGRLTSLTKQEIEMAIFKKGSTKVEAAAAAKAVTGKSGGKKVKGKAAEPTKVKGKKAAAQPAESKSSASKGNGTKGPSAASEFKRLIMEGVMTDDQIFAAVKKQFGLDDSKRSYVAWYRNSLVKGGQKVPAKVEE